MFTNVLTTGFGEKKSRVNLNLVISRMQRNLFDSWKICMKAGVNETEFSVLDWWGLDAVNHIKLMSCPVVSLTEAVLEPGAGVGKLALVV